MLNGRKDKISTIHWIITKHEYKKHEYKKHKYLAQQLRAFIRIIY